MEVGICSGPAETVRFTEAETEPALTFIVPVPLTLPGIKVPSAEIVPKFSSLTLQLYASSESVKLIF